MLTIIEFYHRQNAIYVSPVMKFIKYIKNERPIATGKRDPKENQK